MKRLRTCVLAALAFFLLPLQSNAQDAPFGWAACASLTTSGDYPLTGGGNGRTIVLKSNGSDMSREIVNAVNHYDVIVFDGADGEFIVSSVIAFERVRAKTVFGVNGACLRTGFRLSDSMIAALDSAGVREMSSQGGGGKLSNGTSVREEREMHTRQVILDLTGDEKEGYRKSGVFALDGCENWIIRNIAFVGPGPVDVGGTDLLSFYNGTNHVWVDHCSFTDGMDGNFDITWKSDFITVSWCSFQYTERAYDHRLTNLIGSNDNPENQGADNLNVTFADCLWGKGCSGRMPMARFGNIHVLNCLYACEGNSGPAINARKGSELLAEGCVFEKGVKPFEASDDAKACLKDNIFKGKYSPEASDDVTVPYNYVVLKAVKAAAAVRKEAGPTLELQAPEPTVKTTLHLMGDSTMADKSISGRNPERGWGMVFENFFDDSVRVINYAKNGLSTKSVIDEGIWDEVKANMRPGDYLFIEFGHNDEKLDKPAVGAAAWGAYRDNLRLFIKTAREKGVTPILLTPVARRTFGKDGVLDETTHGEYPAAMKAVAAETGTKLIDMEKATVDWIKAAGDLASRPYFMWVEPGTCPAIPSGREDNTHSTPAGARRNCEIVCDSLRVKIPELASHIVRYDFVVDQQGRGDFMTVQEAIDAVPNYLYKEITTILVKPGIYNERIFIPAQKCCLKIVGYDAENTVIQWNEHASMKANGSTFNVGTSGSAAVFVDASFVTFENITLQNDAGQGKGIGQAVTVSTSGDAIFFNKCRILGWQDTVYTFGRYGAYGYTARSYYKDCYIEGTTDFIFGPGRVLFENCEIHSLADSYITAASTFKGEDYGYVFRNCRLTAAPGVTKVYLGRPWREYARTVYIGCDMGPHIAPEGWHNWGDAGKEKTAFYAEYGNSGPGAAVSGRVPWAHQLTEAEAAAYTFERMMGESGYEELWNPYDNKGHFDATNYPKKSSGRLSF